MDNYLCEDISHSVPLFAYGLRFIAEASPIFPIVMPKAENDFRRLPQPSESAGIHALQTVGMHGTETVAQLPCQLPIILETRDLAIAF